jgi:hypothetical protein
VQEFHTTFVLVREILAAFRQTELLLLHAQNQA